MILKMPRLRNVNQGGRQGWDLLRLVSIPCLGLLLLSTFRLYKGGSYFWLDDFYNLYQVQQTSFGKLIASIVNPVSAYFRPTGMLCYWVLLRFFDLNPAAYHWLAWSFHVANTYISSSSALQGRSPVLPSARCCSPAKPSSPTFIGVFVPFSSWL